MDPAPNPLRVTVQIQAPDESRYAWLNNNIYIGVGGRGGSENSDDTRLSGAVTDFNHFGG